MKPKFSLIACISVILIVLLANLYNILNGNISKDMSIERETRGIYNTLSENIINMKGTYKQLGGRINYGFILESDFSESDIYNKSNIIKKIESMGFNFNSEKSTYRYDVFCKGNSGFLIGGDKQLIIDYRHKMSDCLN